MIDDNPRLMPGRRLIVSERPVATSVEAGVSLLTYEVALDDILPFGRFTVTIDEQSRLWGAEWMDTRTGESRFRFSYRPAPPGVTIQPPPPDRRLIPASPPNR